MFAIPSCVLTQYLIKSMWVGQWSGLSTSNGNRLWDTTFNKKTDICWFNRFSVYPMVSIYLKHFSVASLLGLVNISFAHLSPNLFNRCSKTVAKCYVRLDWVH